MGLLSYALAHDGLERHLADYDPKDGHITISEWLAYAASRVPDLVEEIRLGKLRAVEGATKGLENMHAFGGSVEEPAALIVQRPVVYDPRRAYISTDIWITPTAPPAPEVWRTDTE